MPRNFTCPETGEACDDPRCKRNDCAIAKEAPVVTEAEAASLRQRARQRRLADTKTLTTSGRRKVQSGKVIL
jgi:hypothetical protein